MAVSAEAINNVSQGINPYAMSTVETDIADAIGIGAQRRQQEFNSAEAIAQRAWEEKQNEIVRAYNSAEAALNREFNSAEAEKQRKWEERLANTAHQREIADLKAAGLNPALSVTGGAGSVTPMGSYASGQNASANTPQGASAYTSGAINSAGALTGMINAMTNYHIAKNMKKSYIPTNTNSAKNIIIKLLK